MQLLRFFVAQQITESPSMCSGTSLHSCLPALSKKLFAAVLLPTAAERLHSSGHFAIVIRILVTLDASAQIGKTAFPAHRPRPPQTPAASF